MLFSLVVVNRFTSLCGMKDPLKRVKSILKINTRIAFPSLKSFLPESSANEWNEKYGFDHFKPPWETNQTTGLLITSWVQIDFTILGCPSEWSWCSTANGIRILAKALSEWVPKWDRKVGPNPIWVVIFSSPTLIQVRLSCVPRYKFEGLWCNCTSEIQF